MASENDNQNTTSAATTVTGSGTKAEPSTVDAAVKKYLPYLQEIQKKLVTLLIMILVSGVLGFIYYQQILTFILKLFNLTGITIVMSSPYQFINLASNFHKKGHRKLVIFGNGAFQ